MCLAFKGGFSLDQQLFEFFKLHHDKLCSQPSVVQPSLDDMKDTPDVCVDGESVALR